MGGSAQVEYFCKCFCAIFSFTLLVLGATSHYVLFRNNFCILAVSLTWRVARNLQWDGYFVYFEALSARRFCNWFCKNSLILGLF